MAPQGRRLNAIGGYFSHGPQAGEFRCALFARVPHLAQRADGSWASTQRKELAAVAAEHGLAPEDVGAIDSAVFLAFVWQLAGRPADAPEDWRRERPLVVVIDNYQVHRSQRVKREQEALRAANIELFYLPAYAPELSRIEPQWRAVKYQGLPQRSYATLGELKVAVEQAIAWRAVQLRLGNQATVA